MQKAKFTIIRPRKRTHVKTVTSFLSLPRELRDMIYEEAIDLSGIATNVRNEQLGYYDAIRFINPKRQPQKVMQMIYRLGTRHGQAQAPTMLLINRQIHKEAMLGLQKRSIIFTAPAINNLSCFPMSKMVCRGLMRTVKRIHFEMPMKQHTDAVMAGELQIGSNLFSHHYLDNGSLDDSQPWGHFLGDFIAMLWAPGHRVQHITFSITNGKAGRKDYTLKADQANLSGLYRTIQGCFKSRNLEHFLSYLEYAEMPSTE